LQDLNLNIPARPACVIMIAGESGSSKTALTNPVLGFVLPTPGQIIYDGKVLSTPQPKEIKNNHREVQAVFQDPVGGLRTTQRDRRDMIEEALNVVGLRGEDVLSPVKRGPRRRVGFDDRCLAAGVYS
jgi:ABC-type microcin C transport system duplicated ATPase subunit YejF